MLKQRRVIADKIAASLFEAEAAIDVALAKTAHLAGVMPALRLEAQVSALIGQDALERTSEAFAHLAAARRAIVKTHKELSLVQKQVGLGAVMFGDPGDKPPLVAQSAATPRLKAVRANQMA